MALKALPSDQAELIAGEAKPKKGDDAQDDGRCNGKHCC
jgi:hypothetical protein